MMASSDQTLQYLGWMLALFEFILAAYLLYLNPGKRANRWASLFIAVLALTMFGYASLLGATSPQAAQPFALLIAGILPLHNPLQLLVLLCLFPVAEGFRPSRWKWIQPIIYLLILLLLALVLSDLRMGTGLWFTGLPPGYAGGLAPLTSFTQGSLRMLVYALNFAVCGSAILVFLLAQAVFKRGVERNKRLTARLLIGANLTAALFFVLQQSPASMTWLALAGVSLYTISFGIAIFQDLISERQTRPGTLQTRLTALILMIVIPLMTMITVLLNAQARRGLIDAANDSLATSSTTITEGLGLWLDYNTLALQTMIKNPGIVSMNPLFQKPLVEQMSATYPHMYLVGVIDRNGLNIIRSDDRPPMDYSDRFWFQNARAGAPVTYEALIGRTLNMPTLVVSMPVRGDNGAIVGVGMFATDLEQINALVSELSLGEGASVFIIDERDIQVAHSDPHAQVLANINDHPAVKALRSGTLGMVSYKNHKGEPIQAYVSKLPNNWGVIIQQTEAGLFAPIRQFQRIAFTLLVIGAALMSLLIYSWIRQGLQPIQDLTASSLAISRGDFSRRVEIASQDELGLLSQTFNQMTAQLEELVGSLETRVAERTQALERRVLQSQVTAEVAKEAASIRNPEKLLQDVVNLISTRFNFDHAGIFLLEVPESSGTYLTGESQQGYAVLRAASSTGGQRMLERGHRLRIGRQGLVGFVAATGQPRLALDVGSDSVFFNNPDLPLTRSEIALPLKVQNTVIGVLDVQSNKASAFTEEDLAILQILADQVALAIETSRLLADSQQAVRELEALYGLQIRKGWSKRLTDQPLVYRFEQGAARRLEGPALLAPKPAQAAQAQQVEVSLPIELRGQPIGALKLRRPMDRGNWSESEKELIRETIDQLALSLENARLMEEVRAQAAQEEMINQIVARTQSSLNLETVMKTAVSEIGRIMRLSHVRIRLGAAPDDDGSNGRTGPDEAAGGAETTADDPTSLDQGHTTNWDEGNDGSHEIHPPTG